MPGMNDIMLTLRDAARDIHGAIDDLRLDYIVAALSAEPETIEELQDVLARFLPAAAERAFLDGWESGIRAEPCEAGLAIVDLAARLIVVQVPDYEIGPSGGIGLVDSNGEMVGMPYHLAGDWLFAYDFAGWEELAKERRRARRANPPVDTRPVLYDQVCAFIVESCRAAAAEMTTPLDDRARYDTLSAIHARWLTTPRADLRGQAPRDVLLARKGHIDWDLQDRSHQWTMQLRCPPGLSVDSTAYRCGGYGTHEIVIYYYLVRFLLGDCWERLAGPERPALSDHSMEIRRLEAMRDEWLATLNVEDLSAQTPGLVIAHERARLPEGGSGKDHMIDCDCPLCQMMADMPGPSFWHLDGCNMDNEFAFSFHATHAEWEAEQREYEEFSRRMDEKWAAEEANKPPSVWQRSFVAENPIGGPPSLAVFAIGAHLSELTQDLKDAGAAQDAIDALNRAFGNLGDAVKDPSAALVEPVIERLIETLAAVAEAHPALAEKCTDLERQLGTFTRRLTAEPWEDGELPF